MTYHLAIDIGASGGRHILGHRENGRLVCEEVYRFSSRLVRVNGHDCWDMDTLGKPSSGGAESLPKSV